MTDEQIVLALIDAYKARGIDLSNLLDDHTFAKLPIRSKIEAIQKYSKELKAGINPSLSKLDYKVIGTDMLFDSLTGAAAGGLIGSKLIAKLPLGLTQAQSALSGAALFGIIGGGLAALKAKESTINKKMLISELDKVTNNPSASNALGALSINHMNSGNASYRHELMNKLREKAMGTLNDRLEPYLTEQSMVATKYHIPN